jgi:hypothetical protein
MKNHLSILLIFFSLNTFAQIPEIIWQQCYGTNTSDHTFGIVPTENGYMFAIEVQSGDGLTNYHDLYEIWIVNIDSTGAMLWEKCFGGASHDQPEKIINIGNNEYYVFGSTSSTDGDVQSYHHGYSDLWVVKINGQGDLLWERCYGGPGTDEPRDMIITPDGGFALLARIDTEGGEISHCYGWFDNWIVKCDSLGNIEWELTLGNEGLDNALSMIVNSAGNIMMIGAAMWHGGLVECFPDGEWADIWIVELDMQGNILSQSCYGGSHYDLGYCIIEMDEGYAFIASTYSNDGDVSGLHGPPGAPPEAWNDFWVVRLNEQMEIIWEKCLGGYRSDAPLYITQTEDNGFIVIGFTRSNDGDVSGNPSKPGTDVAIWVVKLTELGDIEWQHCYGGWGSERLENPHTILKKSDYNYVIAASTNFSPSHDVQCETFSGNRNAWIFEIALPDTLDIIFSPASARGIKTYPNPATTELWLQLPENMPFAQAQIELYGPTGSLLYKAQPTSQFHKIETADLLKGLYLLRLWDGKQWFGEKVVVR